MWEKSWERWGGWWEKNPQLLLGLVGILHILWHLNAGGWEEKRCRTFMSWLPNAGEKKNLLPINWGQIIRIQGFPKRAKRMGLNLQIHQKHCPGNWTLVIERQTGQTHFHTATWNKPARHLHTFTFLVSHAGKSTSTVLGGFFTLHTEALACQWQLALTMIVILIRTQTKIKLKHSDNNNESQTRGKYKFKDQDSQENIHILTVELQKVSQS